MRVRVDNNPIPADTLWWPSMNFSQFQLDRPQGQYELEIARTAFVQRLSDAYARCVEELREDDRKFPGQDASPLRDTGYPPLDEVVGHAPALLELLDVFLHEELFAAFVPNPPSVAARFMINSIEEVSAGPDTVTIRGRGYHTAPSPTAAVGASA